MSVIFDPFGISIQQQIVSKIEGWQKEIKNYELKIKEKQDEIKAEINKLWKE